MLSVAAGLGHFSTKTEPETRLARVQWVGAEASGAGRVEGCPQEQVRLSDGGGQNRAVSGDGIPWQREEIPHPVLENRHF